MVHLEHHELSIDGIQLIFIELPKFKSKNYQEKKLNVLWLRYLYELENMTEMVSEDLMSVPEIAEAVELAKESAYTKAQLESYDKYWDSISVEKTFIADAESRGEKKGVVLGEARGIAIGEARGEVNKTMEIVINCYIKGYSITSISEITSLTEEEVHKILSEQGLV